jgi:hypothetical protein
MKAAIDLLNCFCDNQSVPEQDKSVFRQAIRVLEAAGEVDKKKLLNRVDSWIEFYKSVGSAYKGKPIPQQWAEDGAWLIEIRALLEALPEEEK